MLLVYWVVVGVGVSVLVLPEVIVASEEQGEITRKNSNISNIHLLHHHHHHHNNIHSNSLSLATTTGNNNSTSSSINSQQNQRKPSESELVTRVLAALDKALHYYENNFALMNFDGILGAKVVEGEYNCG